MATKKLVKVEEKSLAVNTDWELRMQEMAAEGAKMERTSGSTISLRSGVLSYMGSPAPGNSMQVVVLGASVEHSYYDTVFDSSNIVPPVCFAVSKLDGQPAPHADVPEAQKQSPSCSTCWAHAFKSAENKRGRACSVRRRLALIPATALNDMDTLLSAEIAMLKVSPTSVQNWSKYVNSVAARYQRPIFGVVTEISVKPHPKFQFEVHFEAHGLIDAEDVGQVYKLVSGVEGTLLAPFDMTPKEEEEKVVPPKKAGKKKY